MHIAVFTDRMKTVGICLNRVNLAVLRFRVCLSEDILRMNLDTRLYP